MRPESLVYLGDDLLLLAEVEHWMGTDHCSVLFRASEKDKLPRLRQYGTDRGGYEPKRPWKGSTTRLHEDVILATTSEDIRRGVLDPSYSTSFKKFPGIDEPLLLIYDASAFEPVGPKEYAFREGADRLGSLLHVLEIHKLPMPRGWMSSEEGLYYRQLVQKAGRLVVEVGSWLGRSASYIARVCELTCVDHFAGSDDAYDTAYREVLAEVDVHAALEEHLQHLGGQSRVLVKPSIDAAQRFMERSLDLVFLDASHDERSVRGDIAAWTCRIRKGGILAGHDYDDEHEGVVKALAELPVQLGPGSIWWLEVH